MHINLLDIVLLAVIGFIAWQFWQLRGISEYAKQQVQAYCQKQQLQFISLAREKTRLGFTHGKLGWHCQFVFEFSSTGEESYQGKMTMAGLHITTIDLPPYRIP
jgi:hypothetical protein